jgi:hypothetical protein
MPLLDSVVGVNRHLAERVEGELEALSRSGGRVLDLREAERREAVTADGHRAPARGYGEVAGVPEGYRSRPPGSAEPAGTSFVQDSFVQDSFVQDGRFARDAATPRDPAFGQDAFGQDTFVQDTFGRDGGHGWDGAAVPGARDPISGDLPSVRPPNRDPFSGDPGGDDLPYDGRGGRRDERW